MTIIWVHCLFTGSKKSAAMKCLLNALKTVQANVHIEQLNNSINNPDLLSGVAPGALFSANETITTARLCCSQGVYLNLIDEIEGLFETLEGKSRDHLDRRLWLSLNTGAPVTRSTSQRVTTVEETRLNYTGTLELCIGLNKCVFWTDRLPNT